MDIGYKNPIEAIAGEIKVKYEDDIVKAVQSYNINVDKERLIKALDYDRQQYLYGYEMAINKMMFYVSSKMINTHPLEYNVNAILNEFKEWLEESQSYIDEIRNEAAGKGQINNYVIKDTSLGGNVWI